MKVRELIEQLQELDQDLLVVTYRGDYANHFDGLDGWWPQYVTVSPTSTAREAYVERREGRHDDLPTFEAVILP